MPGPGPGPSRGVVTAVAAAVAVLLLLVVAFTAVTRDEPTPLEEARAIVADDDEFAAARTAGMALLRVSAALKEAGERCAADSGDAGSRRCNPYFAGAGHVQVLAVQVVRCSRPELFDVRRQVLAYVDELAERPDAASLPPMLRCA